MRYRLPGGVFRRVKLHQMAKQQLIEVYEKRDEVIVVHYSCESFYNRQDKSSPRITSIAVRNLATAQTQSFSIHQFAERDDKMVIEDIDGHYDNLEKKMLEAFFDYAKPRMGHTWLHWNMRDSNYGFAALEHRYRVHGGKPVEIPEVSRRDLSRLLTQLYGANYADHPRLQNLMEQNGISNRDFLNGKEEAMAFENRDYVRLHQSTLRKVHVISDIVYRAADGTLETKTGLDGIYGGHWLFWVERIREHWLSWLICFVGAVASIIGLFLWFA